VAVHNMRHTQKHWTQNWQQELQNIAWTDLVGQRSLSWHRDKYWQVFTQRLGCSRLSTRGWCRSLVWHWYVRYLWEVD